MNGLGWLGRWLAFLVAVSLIAVVGILAVSIVTALPEGAPAAPINSDGASRSVRAESHDNLALSRQGVYVAVSPTVLRVEPGQSFTLDVVVGTDLPSRGAQLGLSFDPKLVEVEEVKEGTFFRDWAETNAGSGASTVFLPQPVIDNTRGRVSVVAVLVAGGPERSGHTGEGTLVSYRMKARDRVSGVSVICPTDLLLADDEVNSPGNLPGLTAGCGLVVVGKASASSALSLAVLARPSADVGSPDTAVEYAVAYAQRGLGAGVRLVGEPDAIYGRAMSYAQAREVWFGHKLDPKDSGWPSATRAVWLVDLRGKMAVPDTDRPDRGQLIMILDALSAELLEYVVRPFGLELQVTLLPALPRAVDVVPTPFPTPTRTPVPTPKGF